MAESFSLLPESMRSDFLQLGNLEALSTSSPFYTAEEMAERDAIAMQVCETAQTQIGSLLSSCSSSHPPPSEAILYVPSERPLASSAVSPSVKNCVYAAVFETSDYESDWSAGSGVLGAFDEEQTQNPQSNTAAQNFATRNPALTVDMVPRAIGAIEEPRVAEKYHQLPPAPMRRTERSRGRTRSKVPEAPKRAAKVLPKPKRLAPLLIPAVQTYTRPPTLRLVPKQRIVGFEIKPEDEHELCKVMSYRPEPCPGPINTPDFVGNASLSAPLDIYALHDKLSDLVPSPAASVESLEIATPLSARRFQTPWLYSHLSLDSMQNLGLCIDLQGSKGSDQSPLQVQRSLDHPYLMTTQRRSVSERLASYPSDEKISEYYHRNCTPGFIARYEPLHLDKGGIRPKPVREAIEEETLNRRAKVQVRSHREKSCIERRMLENSERLSTRIR